MIGKNEKKHTNKIPNRRVVIYERFKCMNIIVNNH